MGACTQLALPGITVGRPLNGRHLWPCRGGDSRYPLYYPLFLSDTKKHIKYRIPGSSRVLVGNITVWGHPLSLSQTKNHSSYSTQYSA